MAESLSSCYVCLDCYSTMRQAVKFRDTVRRAHHLLQLTVVVTQSFLEYYQPEFRNEDVKFPIANISIEPYKYDPVHGTDKSTYRYVGIKSETNNNLNRHSDLAAVKDETDDFETSECYDPSIDYKKCLDDSIEDYIISKSPLSPAPDSPPQTTIDSADSLKDPHQLWANPIPLIPGYSQPENKGLYITLNPTVSNNVTKTEIISRIMQNPYSNQIDTPIKVEYATSPSPVNDNLNTQMLPTSPVRFLPKMITKPNLVPAPIFLDTAPAVLNIETTTSSDTERFSETAVEDDTVKTYSVQQQTAIDNLKNDVGDEAFYVVRLSLSEQKEVIKLKRVSKPYKCGLCYKTYQTERDYTAHKACHDSEYGHFVCEVCKMYFKLKKQLTVHLLEHTCKIFCRKCSFFTTTARIFRMHFVKQHNALYPYVCSCGAKFNLLNLLSQHRQTAFCPDNAYANVERPCTECGEPLIPRLITYHMKMRHKESPKKLPNLRVDEKQDFYGCVHCSQTFQTFVMYHLHLKHVHQNYSHWVKCVICGRSCSSSDWLARHVEQDHHATRCPSPLGASEFGTNASLQQHNKTKSSLTNHTRTNAREFVCTQCGDAFVQSASLRKHVLLVHKKIKQNLKPKQGKNNNKE